MHNIKQKKLNYWKLVLVSLLSQPVFAFALSDEEISKKFKDFQIGIETMVEKQRVQDEKIEKKSEKAELKELSDKLQKQSVQIAQMTQVLDSYKAALAALTKELEQLKQTETDKNNALQERISKLEPRKISVDGQDLLVDLAELRAYEDSLQLLRENDYRSAKRSLTGFITIYPQSLLLPSAHFFLGSANKGLNDCKESISAWQVLVTKFTTNPKVPASMLSIGTCQIELKDRAGAKKTFETIVEKFPDSESAQTAKNNLLLMK